MEPSHSPFGLIGQIARDTGWSIRYILHGVNYPTLMLMWRDCPRHIPARRKTPAELSREMSARSGGPQLFFRALSNIRRMFTDAVRHSLT